MKRHFFITLLIAALAATAWSGTALAQVAAATKTMTLGTASGQVNATVALDVKVDDPTGVAGTTFTILYPAEVFSFQGLTQGSKTIDDGSGCQQPGSDPPVYDQCDATQIGSTMFFQANDVKDANGNPVGKVMVAAASAQELTDPTLFKASFTINGGNGFYPIRLVRTIIENPAAGYDQPTLLPVLVGLPAEQPDSNGYYPTPTFATELVDGGITVQAPGYTISGSVQYDNDGDGTGDAPADGSRVVLKVPNPLVSGDYVFLAETTVQNGAYKFGNRPAGDYRIVVHPADPAHFKVKVDLTISADTTHDFLLKTAQRQHGTVTVNGNALPGLRVKVTCDNQVLGVVPADDQGYWETMPLDPAANCTFAAIYGTQEQPVNGGDTPEDWALTLYSISGTVSGLTPGADVEVSAGSPTVKLLRGTKATADGSGNAPYTIDNLLPAADYIASAATQGAPIQYYNNKSDITQADSVDISTGDATNIDFSFASVEGGTISGRVTRNNAGVNDVQVFVFGKNTAGNFVALSVLTANDGNQDGAYTMAVPPGAYQVFVQEGGTTFYYAAAGTTQSALHADTVTVNNGDQKTGIDIDLTLCDYAISGKVTLQREDGEGLAGALLTARSDTSVARTFSEADGSYTIPGLCAGSYTVIMDPLQPGYPPVEKNATIDNADVTVNFVFATGWTLTGTVTDKDTGNPVAEAQVYLINEETGQRFGRPVFTSGDGSYAIRDIPSGVYGLNVTAKGFAKGLVPSLEISGDTTQDVQLEKGAWVYGTVTDATTNDPLGGVTVTAVPVNDTTLPVRFARTVETGNDKGKYAIYGLSSTASYILRFGGKRGYEPAYTVMTTPPATTGTQEDKALQPVTATFTLQGTVTGCDGGPAAGALVMVSYQPGAGVPRFFADTRTGNDGSYTIANLPQNSAYTLMVLVRGANRIYQESNLDWTGNATVTKDVTVPCGGTISGTVTAADANQVVVKLYTTAGAYVDHKVLTTKDQNGGFAYAFTGLDDTTTYRVGAGDGTNAKWYDGAASRDTANDVSVGTTNADITLP